MELLCLVLIKSLATTWAVGGAWNVHNENFIKDNTDILDVLKIRTFCR